ncbi:MAG: SIS domain-containing protein [Chlorobi bacterium]|nr:SIS domain-containing protein [Chlorobiota bacterium]
MKKEDIIQNLTDRYPELETCRDEILEACNTIISCYENDGKVLVCGNGGSAADADHIVGELMKSFMKSRTIDHSLRERLTGLSAERGACIAEKLQCGLPAISLNAHTSLITAIANDMDADLIFAQQITGYGNRNDVLVAISTSGNAQNVMDAAITAKAKGLTVIGLTGKSGGKLKRFCDISICVPADSTPEVQEFHLPVYHTICKIVENSFY